MFASWNASSRIPDRRTNGRRPFSGASDRRVPRPEPNPSWHRWSEIQLGTRRAHTASKTAGGVLYPAFPMSIRRARQFPKSSKKAYRRWSKAIVERRRGNLQPSWPLRFRGLERPSTILAIAVLEAKDHFPQYCWTRSNGPRAIVGEAQWVGTCDWKETSWSFFLGVLCRFVRIVMFHFHLVILYPRNATLKSEQLFQRQYFHRGLSKVSRGMNLVGPTSKTNAVYEIYYSVESIGLPSYIVDVGTISCGIVAKQQTS